MDYIGNKCPVCQKYFHADDDIVVCPDCGTPHHRECYEQLGHCAHEDLHAQGFDFTETAENTDQKVKRCPTCGEENEEDAFFCKHCGNPLSPEQPQKQQEQPAYGAGGFSPFGANPQQNSDGTYNIPFLDPLGGVPAETDLGDGITAGEAAKYVKQNTPYFIRVFSNIKNFNKSKFNFAAALFTGGYLLYRKMYKIGAVIAGIQLMLMIVESYLTIAFSDLYTEFAQAYINASSTAGMFDAAAKFIGSATPTQVLVLYLPTLIDVVRIVMMIVVGLCFNRMYLNHCKKQIIAIKQSALEADENPDTLLQTKGGVNTALAVSLVFTVMIVTYLPRIIVGMF